LKSVYQIINDQFYKQFSLIILLLPLSLVFYILLKLRIFFYSIGLFESIKLSRPVIVIGNITLGGTGKTSLIQKLIGELIKKEISVGVISRGYGAIVKTPLEVLKNSKVEDVGDEALLLKKKYDIPIFVGKDKAATGQFLIDQYPNVQLILSDDGLQHYKLNRDLEICIIDGQRGFGNNLLLPSGPLREPKSRLKKCDFIVLNENNNNNNNFNYDYLMTYKNPNFVMNRNNQIIKFKELKDRDIFIMTAIGNPNRLIKFFRSFDFEFKYKFFNDHYFFKQEDFDGLEKKFIVMTEKDIVKCENINHDNIWYLPVSVEIDEGFINEIYKLIK
jgi:tetraacyldisaccharide 4'-kinase